MSVQDARNVLIEAVNLKSDNFLYRPVEPVVDFYLEEGGDSLREYDAEALDGGLEFRLTGGGETHGAGQVLFERVEFRRGSFAKFRFHLEKAAGPPGFVLTACQETRRVKNKFDPCVTRGYDHVRLPLGAHGDLPDQPTRVDDLGDFHLDLFDRRRRRIEDAALHLDFDLPPFRPSSLDFPNAFERI